MPRRKTAVRRTDAQRALLRREQLRSAKQAQRTRDREAGLVLCQLKLRSGTAERLRRALAVPGFEADLAAFLDGALVDVRAYPTLRLLRWNSPERFIPAREALALYERNWRFVDVAQLAPEEQALIERLVREHGNGVLNA